jgi:hypothetical protein
MAMYQVDFEYNLPEFGTVELEADSEEEAEELAKEQFVEMYPEAVDLEIIGVNVIG